MPQRGGTAVQQPTRRTPHSTQNFAPSAYFTPQLWQNFASDTGVSLEGCDTGTLDGRVAGVSGTAAVSSPACSWTSCRSDDGSDCRVLDAVCGVAGDADDEAALATGGVAGDAPARVGGRVRFGTLGASNGGSADGFDGGTSLAITSPVTSDAARGLPGFLAATDVWGRLAAPGGASVRC